MSPINTHSQHPTPKNEELNCFGLSVLAYSLSNFFVYTILFVRLLNVTLSNTAEVLRASTGAGRVA